MIQDPESFDNRVERFLKNQLSADEDKSFRMELAGNPDLKKRAQTIALMVQQMKELQREQTVDILKRIQDFSNDETGRYIPTANRIEEFDELVDRFLMQHMSADEEHNFKSSMLNNKYLLERARTIALMLQEMKSIKADEDSKIVESIQRMNEAEYYKAAGIPIPMRRKPVVRLWSQQIMKYAAVSIIILFLGLAGNQYYAHRKTIELGEIYLEKVPTAISGQITKGDNDEEIIEQLSHLFTAVTKGGNMRQTIAELEPIYQESQSDNVNDYSDYANEIAWNLAIAYLKAGNRKSSLEVLNKIIADNKGKALSDKAIELINAIHSIVAF